MRFRSQWKRSLRSSARNVLSTRSATRSVTRSKFHASSLLSSLCLAAPVAPKLVLGKHPTLHVCVHSVASVPFALAFGSFSLVGFFSLDMVAWKEKTTVTTSTTFHQQSMKGCIAWPLQPSWRLHQPVCCQVELKCRAKVFGYQLFAPVLLPCRSSWPYQPPTPRIWETQIPARHCQSLSD